MIYTATIPQEIAGLIFVLVANAVFFWYVAPAIVFIIRFDFNGWIVLTMAEVIINLIK